LTLATRKNGLRRERRLKSPISRRAKNGTRFPMRRHDSARPSPTTNAPRPRPTEIADLAAREMALRAHRQPVD
jgi:hypothetical protein